MHKYFVLYKAPAAEFQKLMRNAGKMSESDRNKGMDEWNKWMKDHKNHIRDMGAPLGKTKVASKKGVKDGMNDIGGYSIVEADSQEEAAEMFAGDHPHYQIPKATIEVMEVMEMPGM